MVSHFKTANDLAEAVRQPMIDLLNQELAALFDLYSQTKQAHWNVRGMNFIALHKLFDDLASDLPELIDMLAERAASLGGYVFGTARMAAKASALPEFPSNISEAKAVLEALIQSYAKSAKTARAAIDSADKAGDKDTADLFTEISLALDKKLWFLEAHLQ